MSLASTDERRRERACALSFAGRSNGGRGGGVAAGTWWGQHDDEAVSPGTYVPPSQITSTTPSSSSTTTTKKPKKTSTSSSTTAATRSDATHTPAPKQAPAGTPTRVQVTSGGRELVDASLGATKLDAQKVLAPPYGTAGWYAEPGWPKPGCGWP